MFRSNALTLGNLLKPQHISKFTDYGHVMRFFFQTIPNVSAIWADGPKKIVWYLSYFGYTFLSLWVPSPYFCINQPFLYKTLIYYAILKEYLFKFVDWDMIKGYDEIGI